jgi:small subunit ribosomal protein S18
LAKRTNKTVGRTTGGRTTGRTTVGRTTGGRTTGRTTGGRTTGRMTGRTTGRMTGRIMSDRNTLNSSLNVRQRKRFCYFCKENITHIDYKNVSMLKKFVSDKGKIRPKRSTGNCVQHQKMIADAIKRAREIALMPYFRR